MTRVKRHCTSDLMDEWLESQGYYRKHTAKDGSCLFRAVSEQVFHTQALHFEVRMTCVQFMERNREQFEEFVEGSFDNHLCNLQDPKEWAGQVEMSAMALLFHHDFEVFHEAGKGPYKVTDNKYKNKILLYFSQGNHYDSVYSRNFIADAAVCQSTVYEILYKRVFAMGEDVDLAVEKMLHDKAYAKLRKDSTASIDSNCASPEFGILLDQENDSSGEGKDKEPGSEIRRALALGLPPFPYKVAKALDTEIYRNVEFDIWNEAKKDEIVFEPGMKCLVRLDKDSPEVYHAHIQEITLDKGPVTVYIVELGKKQTVSYENLEPLPLSYNKGCWQTLGKSYKAVSAFYQKPNLSESIYDIDKGKKKIFKKGKFKFQDFSFSLPLPRGQGLAPRFQSHQSQYETPVVSVGRGRGSLPYHGVPRLSVSKVLSSRSYRRAVLYMENDADTPLQEMVANFGVHTSSSTISIFLKKPHHFRVKKVLVPKNETTSELYRQRTVSAGRYCVSNAGYSINENTNRIFEPKMSYNTQDVNDLLPQPLPKSPSQSTTSVTWVKSIGSVAASTATIENGGGCVNNNNKNMEPQGTPTTSPIGVIPGTSATSSPGTSVTVSAPTCISQPILVPSYPPVSSCCGFSVPCTVSSTAPPPASPLVQSVSQSPLSSPTYITPQPIAVYPYQCYAGVYVPFDPPVQPVNYSVARSQDPNGSDLPLQDLATLRFFYNLGCDYFRIATVIPVPPSQCAVWNYGNQMTYSSVNGYLTPMPNSDGCEGVEDSSSTSATCLSPSDCTAEAEGLPMDELYEPAYVYGSPSISFVPAIYQPLDYCAPVPGLVGEFKSGLVLNEHGILSLNTSPCVTSVPVALAPRQRSDSCSSNHSQGSNQDWNLGHPKGRSCSFTSINSMNGNVHGVSDAHVNGSYKSGTSSSCGQHSVPSTWGNASGHLTPRLHKMSLSPQKQPTCPFQSQPVVQVGVAPAPSTFPLVPTPNPILTASPPQSLSVYSSTSPAGATVLAATPTATYYGPSPPTVLFPAAHPQPLSFMPTSAQ